MKSTVYIALGSNVGDREVELRRALHLMDSHDLVIRRVSSVYETAPMYNEDQGPFLNAVVEVSTTLYPMRLLLRLHNIERTMGRTRTVPNSPRPIDLDILLYGSERVDLPGLTIPHPRMYERRFVLEPLHEIAPDLGLEEKLNTLPRQGVVRTSIRLTD